MSKFTGIKFPFFGLHNVPFKIRYEGPRIYVTPHELLKERIMDDIALGDSYFERLVKLTAEYPDDRLFFDETSPDMLALIHSNSKWGIDCSGMIFDISNKEVFNYKYRKIKRHTKDAVWIKTPNYPFLLPQHLKDLPDLTDYHLGIVYIDGTWYVHDLTLFPEDKVSIIL